MHKKLPLLLGLIMVAVLGQAQTIRHNALIIGHVDSVTSAVLHEKRKLWVYVPASDPLAAPQHYAVVYLLDGEAHFTSVVSIVERLSSVASSVLPPLMVVGIANTDRTRDFTPTHLASSPLMPAAVLKSSGGGEAFTIFLEKELIPYIDAHYPTAPHRTLLGHSLGGVLVMNTLLNHPALFNNYVAIDPSLWWDDGQLLKQAHDVLGQPRLAGRSLFVAAANDLLPGLDTVRVRRDTTPETALIRSTLALRDELNRLHGPGLRAASRYYPNDTHNSVTLVAAYDALRFLYQPYSLPPSGFLALFNPASKVPAATFLEAHYRQASARLGYPVSPPEALVNGLAYTLLQQGRGDQALALFQLNVRNYPTSFGAHDGLGDGYRTQDDPSHAAEAYAQALKLQENPGTRQKLTQLQAKK